MIIDEDKQKSYNAIPVYYCTRCRSLKVLRVDPAMQNSPSICGECGSLYHISKSNISTLIENGIIKNPITKGNKKGLL